MCFVGFVLVSLKAEAQKFSFFGIDSLMSHEKGNIHYGTLLEHYFSEELNPSFVHKPISITQFGTQVDYYLVARLAVGGVLQFTLPRGERVVDGKGMSANTFGTSTLGSVRLELLNLTNHNFYIETQQGMVFTLEPFPPGGTRWNFLVKYGFGYCINLAAKRYLQFGWRWIHISNGTGLVPTNPAYDGSGIYIGFRFAK